MVRRKGETSYKETAFGIIPRSKLLELEIEGIDRVWKHVLKHTHTNTRITPSFLKGLQEIGFGWIFPETSGKFRRVDVEVSNHKPPVFFMVSQLMSDYCEDLHERLIHLPSIQHDDFLQALIELLAWAHHRLLWIHPFFDYNGRIARLLTNVILLKLGLPPIELKVDTRYGRDKYIRALQDGDCGNYQKLEAVIKDAIEEAVEELRKC